jgi:DNA-cytosine methyltransferase
MNVLSLFDGMSCGMIALDRLGIKVDKYYASEIDKYAIEVSQNNYPEIIQIGDVCNIKAEDYQDIDLILSGSPCQGFSFAGKQLAFDDPRSALFFEFIRLLKEIKPKYFLLENVNMKKEFLDVISEQVSSCYPELPFGIERIKINSALVSAQNRVRWYWTNIPEITQPKQRGIVLRDILETNSFENSAETHDTPKQIATAIDVNGHDILKRVYSEDGKSPVVTTCGGGNTEPKVVAGAWRGRSLDESGKNVAWKETKPKQMLELRKDEKSNSLTSVRKDNIVSLTRDTDQDVYWRKITPIEAERLQTVPDNYTDCVSTTQRLKCLGNGWTIEVITHILKNMEL